MKTLLKYSFVIFLCFGCRQANTRENENTPLNQSREQPTHVKVYQTQYSVFAYQIQSVGKIRAFKEQKLFSEINGIVDVCQARNGQPVTNGALLVKFNSESIALKMNKVRENIYNTKLNYQSDLLSQESLLQNKSKGIRDTVYRKLKVNSGLSAAEGDLKDLNLEMTKSVIRAPFTGTIASLNVQQGQRVRIGDELLTIYSQSELYLEAKILETDLVNVHLGQQAVVITISSKHQYKALVQEINPLVDENGLISVRLKLSEFNGLIPGMNAQARISVPLKKAISIPKQAVVMREGKAVVFTVEGKLAKWNYVVIGRDDGANFEILEGLKKDQKVIVTNNMQLAHDSPVNVEN